MAIIEIDQTQIVPPVTVRRGNFVIRYAFYPKIELHKRGKGGEDYIVVRVEGNKIAFALCDGVGSSYFGGLASQFVGELLISSLWSEANNPTNFDLVKKLEKRLNQELELADVELDRRTGQLDSGLQKRLGSLRDRAGAQTNFVCGVVSLDSSAGKRDKISLFWLGDAKLQIFEKKSLISEFTGKSAEAWSSKSGVLGQIHSYTSDEPNIDGIIAFSDGLNPSANKINRSLTNADLENAFRESQAVKDDDVSYLEIELIDSRRDTADEIGPRVREILNRSLTLEKSKAESSMVNVITANEAKNDEAETGTNARGWVLSAFLLIALLLSFGFGLVLGGNPFLRTRIWGDRNADLQATNAAIVDDIVATFVALETQAVPEATLSSTNPGSDEAVTPSEPSTPTTTPSLETPSPPTSP